LSVSADFAELIAEKLDATLNAGLKIWPKKLETSLYHVVQNIF